MRSSCLKPSKSSADNIGVVDLFSGCGGFALGFSHAGLDVACGIDIDEAAVNTAAYNLHWRNNTEHSYVYGDIKEYNAGMFGIDHKSSDFIVIGGPPCQAYSRAGKGKLRSLGEHRVNLNDERGFLFEHFLRICLEFDARAVVMENVPESTNYGDFNVPEYVCETLEENGYKAVWTILNAADYGVPQMRGRVFVIAIKGKRKKALELPKPTHRSDSTENVAASGRFKRFSESSERSHFVTPVSSRDASSIWVTVGEAISDLPQLFLNEKSKYRLYPPNLQLPYKCAPQNEFQFKMRTWHDSIQKQVTGHCFRKTDRDFPIFARMKPRDDFRQASQIADAMLGEACRIEGIVPDESNERYCKLKKNFVPPYDRTQFFEKWKRLDPGAPSHTLVAHLGTDTYSHIHPFEPRGISLREAARLQSFPDSFLFQCSMSDAFKQIGNAVPPLLAKALADCLIQQI